MSEQDGVICPVHKVPCEVNPKPDSYYCPKCAWDYHLDGHPYVMKLAMAGGGGVYGQSNKQLIAQIREGVEGLEIALISKGDDVENIYPVIKLSEVLALLEKIEKELG